MSLPFRGRQRAQSSRRRGHRKSVTFILHFFITNPNPWLFQSLTSPNSPALPIKLQLLSPSWERLAEEVGFVAVKNHGIPAATIEGLYSNTKAFFALPSDVKRKYEIAGLAGQRGYTSFGKEHAKGSTAPDLKEFFQFGQTVEDNDPIRSEYPPNVQVKELPDFNSLFIQAYRSFERSGSALLQAIALYLGLEGNTISTLSSTMAIPSCARSIIPR